MASIKKKVDRHLLTNRFKKTFNLHTGSLLNCKQKYMILI